MRDLDEVADRANPEEDSDSDSETGTGDNPPNLPDDYLKVSHRSNRKLWPIPPSKRIEDQPNTVKFSTIFTTPGDLPQFSPIGIGKTQKSRLRGVDQKPRRSGEGFKNNSGNLKLPKIKKSTIEDHITPAVSMRQRSKRRPKKPSAPAWLPSTKHEHALTGCAPNGLRLFPEPPSYLLPKSGKYNRDKQLRERVAQIRQEIDAFDKQQRNSPTSYSFLATSEARGKLCRDFFEIERVATVRCASRWAPTRPRNSVVRS